jgi:putative redox protein
MGIAAQKAGWPFEEARATVEKHMTATPPRRVAKLVVDVVGPAGLDAAAQAALEKAGETCPVRLSLSESIEVVTRYTWG